MTEQHALCSIDGCEKPVRLRGWCGMHHQRFIRHGDPLHEGRARRLPGRTIEERFFHGFTKVESGCWMWTGGHRHEGYGELASGKRRVSVHRLSYEIHHGSIPEGMTVDHLCHTRDKSCPGGPDCPHRACVNPDHLEVVTRAENVRRGRHKEKGARRRDGITHCPHGHEYTPENSFYQRDGRRRCRTCMREQSRRNNERRKAAKRADA